MSQIQRSFSTRQKYADCALPLSPSKRMALLNNLSYRIHTGKENTYFTIPIKSRHGLSLYQIELRRFDWLPGLAFCVLRRHEKWTQYVIQPLKTGKVLSLLHRLGQRFRCRHGPYYCRGFFGYPAAAPHGTPSDDSELDAHRIQICFKFPCRIFLSRPARDCVRACDEGANKSVDGPSKLRNATLARSRTWVEFSSHRGKSLPALNSVFLRSAVRSLAASSPVAWLLPYIHLHLRLDYVNSGLFRYRKPELQLFALCKTDMLTSEALMC